MYLNFTIDFVAHRGRVRGSYLFHLCYYRSYMTIKKSDKKFKTEESLNNINRLPYFYRYNTNK